MRVWGSAYFALSIVLFSLSYPLSALNLSWLSRITSSGTIDAEAFFESIQKLNAFEKYAFIEAYRNDTVWVFYSNKKDEHCWVKLYDSDEMANSITNEIVEYHYPVFRYANWVGNCLSNETETLAKKIRYILIGSGQWKE